MWKLLSLIATALLLLACYRTAVGLRRNVAAAKASGFRYRITPLFWLEPWWVLIGPTVVEYGQWLLGPNRRWWWLEHLSPMQSWTHKYATFEELGADMLMLVSPTHNWLTIANADAIAQISQRRNDFPKPIKYYTGVDVYGKNVVSTEGQNWRHHRRIVAPSFNEKNNRLVWEESVGQAQNMLRSWMSPLADHSSPTITTLAQDSMRLSLYVISKAGFGRSIAWPGIDKQASSSATHENEANLAVGHGLTYTAALSTLLRQLMLVIAIPRSILKSFPNKGFQDAYAAFREFGMYLEEIYEQKRAEMKHSNRSDDANDNGHVDLITGLVRASVGDADQDNKSADKTMEKALFTREEVLGNAFVILLAGHETTANSIHFSLILLAMHPGIQKRVQAELDAVFGTRPTTQWNYDKDLPRLANGLLGAVMAEQLRLIPAVRDVPKWTPTTQPLEVQGQRYTVPAGTYVSLCATAAQRNPNFWPSGPASTTRRSPYVRGNADNDLEEFKPERWLASNHGGPTTSQGETGVDEGDHAASSSAFTALYHPRRGAYLPFSEGHRSCLGRRFAQVEFLAVMAVILRSWTLELAVDRWASDAEVEGMGSEEKRKVWEQARFAAEETLARDMGGLITLQLRHGVTIPLRLVKRGSERFVWNDQQ